MKADETQQAKALRIVKKELKSLGWTKAELARRRKVDASKMAVAQRIREPSHLQSQFYATADLHNES